MMGFGNSNKQQVVQAVFRADAGHALVTIDAEATTEWPVVAFAVVCTSYGSTTQPVTLGMPPPDAMRALKLPDGRAISMDDGAMFASVDVWAKSLRADLLTEDWIAAGLPTEGSG